MRTFNVVEPYKRESFIEFLTDFLPEDFECEQEELFLTFTNIDKGYKLGISKSLDLNVFEFSTISCGDPRVTLTKEVVSFMKKYMSYSNALVIFYSDDSQNWRLSLITTDYEEENGKIVRRYSNPKRYSFLLGNECKEHTPKTMLFKKGGIKERSESGKKLNPLEDLQSRFAVETVTKEFYKEIFAWYEWACSLAKYPQGKGREVSLVQDNNAVNLIRLITRLMFVWFIKQKDLIPSWIFDITELQNVLTDFVPDSLESGNYYNAVLQNLFFATLNQKIENRSFAERSGEHSSKYGIKICYRDDNRHSFFTCEKNDIIERFKSVPFLNGGLFECLDTLGERENGSDVQYYKDGFSREGSRRAFLPNALFWQKEKDGHEGLIHILNRYNFTVEESSPTDIQVALDPELLGKVFENLLGTYNPETKETARKSSGSFYTPREIVDFMVDESLQNYLQTNIPEITEEEIRTLFNDDETEVNITDNKKIKTALMNVKIFDPACGSGAFPVGMLKRLVHLIKKTDTDFYKTKSDVYNLKLHIIENCIFGSDIQSIAVQIAKLRFFITLICEQEKSNDIHDNYGIKPLPNLETQFVAADTLIGLKEEQKNVLAIKDETLEKLKNDLIEIRAKHFNANTSEVKRAYRKQDKDKRKEIIAYLKEQKKSAHPGIIKKYEKKIAELKKEMDNLPKEMVEQAPEQDLFNTNPTQIHVYDKNETKRIGLKKELRRLQKNLESEKDRKFNDEESASDLQNLVNWDPYNQNAVSPFFDYNWMYGIEDGFDIVIGNPPYVSTKNISDAMKKNLEKEFNFVDDLYSHFFFKGLSLLKKNANLCYITSKTYWTIQTKKNLRELLLSKTINYIFDTASPFEAAMVDTCIISIKNASTEENLIVFLDGKQDLKKPKEYSVQQSIYKNAQNSVIFTPNEYNMHIYKLYGKRIRQLYNVWWDKIKTSRDIEKNKKELEEYRKSLKPGDIALLGCLTEGGQGLATANNGKYVAVRKSSKWAKNIENSRPQKLAAALKEYNIHLDGMDKFTNVSEYLQSLDEKKIVKLFDDLKEKYGRNIFGQGYIYRIINDSELADIEKLTPDEKENGIDTDRNFYVPYDKGDKDGNRWYLETPYAIAWSKENVRFLKTNSGKKGEGMPVVRNPQFYFKEGFCWSDINTTFLKCRIKIKSINDVKSMSLYGLLNIVPEYFIISIINSTFISYYVDTFINNTQTFQINDARQIPVIVPNDDNLLQFRHIYEKAINIKRKQFSTDISSEAAENLLSELQQQLDKLVENLYSI